MWPPRTLAITDRARLAARGEQGEDAWLVAFVAAMAAAGVDAVQVRERDWPDRRLLRVVQAARVAVQGSGCRLFVNERAHVAVAAGAQGVHLRRTGMPAARVREAWPSGLLIGRSVHVDDDVADSVGADMVLFGTVFPSVSKGPGGAVAGLGALAAWTQRPGQPPVVAVGGLELERCALVREAGACGMAGIDVFVRAWQQGPSALASVVREIHAVFRDGERAE